MTLRHIAAKRLQLNAAKRVELWLSASITRPFRFYAAPVGWMTP